MEVIDLLCRLFAAGMLCAFIIWMWIQNLHLRKGILDMEAKVDKVCSALKELNIERIEDRLYYERTMSRLMEREKKT